jgi:HPt (histidine-containing phosphotransfer) domain-containing protein
MSDTDQIFMEELKQEFIETTAKNLVDLKQLFKEGNLEEIAKIAHDIKGTSGIFGYDEGTEIARELNIAAKQNNVDKTEDLIDKLADYMKKVGVV